MLAEVLGALAPGYPVAHAVFGCQARSDQPVDSSVMRFFRGVSDRKRGSYQYPAQCPLVLSWVLREHESIGVAPVPQVPQPSPVGVRTSVDSGH